MTHALPPASPGFCPAALLLALALLGGLTAAQALAISGGSFVGTKGGNGNASGLRPNNGRGADGNAGATGASGSFQVPVSRTVATAATVPTAGMVANGVSERCIGGGAGYSRRPPRRLKVRSVQGSGSEALAVRARLARWWRRQRWRPGGDNSGRAPAIVLH